MPIRRGFSLLELVVVIALVVLLAGLLLPAARLVHDAARDSRCLSNLRQMAMGAQAWGVDHHGLLMPACWWEADVGKNTLASMDITASARRCPAYPASSGDSYGINQSIDSPWSGPGSSGDGIAPWGAGDRYYWQSGNTVCAAVRQASEKVYFCDASCYVAGYWWSVLDGRRHRGRAEIAWIDGHCSVEPPDYPSAAPAGTYFARP